MYSFPKNLRLLCSPEFRRVLDFGAKAVRPEFVIFCIPSEGSAKGSHPGCVPSRRLGLIVSKKVGNSVERNFVKRRLREIFRQDVAYAAESLVSQGNEPKAMDIVVIARGRASSATCAQLTVAWQNGLRQANEAWVRRSALSSAAKGAVIHAS